MLTERERHDIDAALRQYPDTRAGCVDALQVIQKHRGWVSDESLKTLAGVLDMTCDELDGVATFYNLIFRKPVGKHVILLCDSISCWIKGSDVVCGQLKTRLNVSLGQISVDGRFTLLPIVCLGACDHAPTMMIDDDLHEDLTAEKLDPILAQYP